MGYLRSDKYKFVARATLNNAVVTKDLSPEFSRFSIDGKEDDFKNEVRTSGQLTFINNNAHSVYDYDFIKQCEAQNISTRIDIDVWVSGQLKYQGFFYPYQCNFDDNNCTATVKLTTDDAYDCIQKYWDTKENILKEVNKADVYRINPAVVLHTIESEQYLYCDVIFPPPNPNCRTYETYTGNNISHNLPHNEPTNQNCDNGLPFLQTLQTFFVAQYLVFVTP